MKSISDYRLLRPTEVADLLGLSVQTLAMWRTTSRYSLRYTKVGRLVSYAESDVLDFIESRTASPGEERSSESR